MVAPHRIGQMVGLVMVASFGACQPDSAPQTEEAAAEAAPPDVQPEPQPEPEPPPPPIPDSVGYRDLFSLSMREDTVATAYFRRIHERPLPDDFVRDHKLGSWCCHDPYLMGPRDESIWYMTWFIAAMRHFDENDVDIDLALEVGRLKDYPVFLPAVSSYLHGRGNRLVSEDRVALRQLDYSSEDVFFQAHLAHLKFRVFDDSLDQAAGLLREAFSTQSWWAYGDGNFQQMLDIITDLAMETKHDTLLVALLEGKSDASMSHDLHSKLRRIAMDDVDWFLSVAGTNERALYGVYVALLGGGADDFREKYAERIANPDYEYHDALMKMLSEN